MSSNESMAYDAAMHQYEKQYDGLKAELQTLGFMALLKQVWVGLRPVGSADKSGAAEERWLGTEVDSRLSTAQARWLGAMSGRR